MSYDHLDKYGPKSDTALARENVEKQNNAVEPSVNCVTFPQSRTPSIRLSHKADIPRNLSTARSTYSARQEDPSQQVETTPGETV